MNWNDWQTWAALGAIALAMGFLLKGLFKKRSTGGGCGGGCGCEKKPAANRPPR